MEVIVVSEVLEVVRVVEVVEVVEMEMGNGVGEGDRRGDRGGVCWYCCSALDIVKKNQAKLR